MKKTILVLVSLGVLLVTLTGCFSHGKADSKYSEPYSESTTEVQITEPSLSETVETTESVTEARKQVTQNTTVVEKTAPDEETTASLKPLPQSDISKCDNTIFNMTNEERKDSGIARYEWSDNLHHLAAVRAKEASLKWSHTRPDGTGFHTVFDEYGVYYTDNCGENLGYISNGDMTALFKSFMDSESHRANILSRQYRYCGIGTYVADDGKTYIAMLFSD